MNFCKLFLTVAIASSVTAAAASDIDYTRGIFVVNEDWYGHSNSTVNYLLPDEADGDCWHYRVIQTENPGRELGCTNQFGAIWDGRFYLIAKQAKDPGASVTGGRITVADATTLKILHQSELIDGSGAQCDGRGFLGIDSKKGYVSSSNGIWRLNLETFEIEGQVEGTANPNAGGDNDKPAQDASGALYHGQSGTMVLAAGRVFAAHQSAGLLVIDPVDDKVIKTISMDRVAEGAGIGSVVKARDGSLWVSIARDITGTGAVINKLLRVDPETLDSEVVDLGPEIFGPSNSWYAWTPDAFCASGQHNVLYWKGGANSWFSGVWVYKFDVDTRHAEKIIDLQADGENWILYGCSMRVHPQTDELYLSLCHGFTIPTYITRRYNADGTRIRDYDMISNYWFPSLFVFPQSEANSGDAPIVGDTDGTPAEIGWYDLSGRPVSSQSLAPGIYVRRSGKSSRLVKIK